MRPRERSHRNFALPRDGLVISPPRNGLPETVFVRFDSETAAGLHPRDRSLPFTPALSGAIMGEAGAGASLIETRCGARELKNLASFLERHEGLAVFEVNPGQKVHLQRLFSLMTKKPPVTAAYGLYANVAARNQLEDGLVDFRVTGEGEAVIPAFAAWVTSGRKVPPPPGLRWIERGAPRDSGPARPALTDEMPFIPAAVLKSNRYHKNSFPAATGRPLRWGFVLANRGCRYSCVFCTGMTRQSLDTAYRLCSPRRLADEMECQFTECGRTIISIEDDLFTGDRDWTLEVCGLLEEAESAARPWVAQTRFDCLDEETAAAMRRAGCVGLTCGVESGSDNVLRALNKQQDTARIRETAIMLRRLGFATRYTAMIGSPGESAPDAAKTFALLSELNPLIAQMAFCSPYPDTRLAGRADADAKIMRFELPMNNASEISGGELAARRNGFYRRFYISRRYAAAHAREWMSYLLYNPGRALTLVYLFARFMLRQKFSAGALRAS